MFESCSSLIARRRSSAASLWCRTELTKSRITSSGDTFLLDVVGVSGAGVPRGSPALGKKVCCGILVALPKEFGTLTGIGAVIAASRSCGEGFISRTISVSNTSPGARATGGCSPVLDASVARGTSSTGRLLDFPLPLLPGLEK